MARLFLATPHTSDTSVGDVENGNYTKYLEHNPLPPLMRHLDGLGSVGSNGGSGVV